MNKIEALEKLLTASIDAFLAGGGELVCRAFGGYEYQKCAIKTIKLDTVKVEVYAEHFSTLTGFAYTSDEIWSFIEGFDGFNTQFTSQEFLDLGIKFREKYKPIDG